MAILLEGAEGLSRIVARVSGAGNRVVDAIEREMRVQIPLLVDQVRGNIGERFNNPGLMQSAIGSDVTRASTAVYGAVDASGRLSGVVLPYMAIQETGGTVNVPAFGPRDRSALAFFDGGVQFFAHRVRAHAVNIPAHHYMRDAIVERREAMIEAFRRVTGGALVDRTGV